MTSIKRIFLWTIASVAICVQRNEKCREYLGCWKDTADRAVANHISNYDTATIVDNCHDIAATSGNSVFAVQATVQCFTATDAEATYQKYGQSTNCQNGVGGSWANDVYKIVSCKPDRYRCRKYLGCWKDTGDRAVANHIDNIHTTTVVDNCHDIAATSGNSVFAVQATVQCFTAADAEATYQKYGQSADCHNGVGGPWANDVYKIASCRPERYRCREYLGCWKDTADRAISGGSEHFDTRTVENCHDLAATRGNSVFAVQYMTQCYTAADAEATYQKFGQSSDCHNGVGGSWANDVYKIVSCPPDTADEPNRGATAPCTSTTSPASELASSCQTTPVSVPLATAREKVTFVNIPENSVNQATVDLLSLGPGYAIAPSTDEKGKATLLTTIQNSIAAMAINLRWREELANKHSAKTLKQHIKGIAPFEQTFTRAPSLADATIENKLTTLRRDLLNITNICDPGKTFKKYHSSISPPVVSFFL
ncbi:hypothetical protein ACHWQZ_G017479 [Mnemiopsis leidyi]